MTYDESYFHDADAPWMPKLIDIEHYKTQTDIPDKAEYFSKFGFDQIDYGPFDDQDEYVGDYPHIADRWEILCQRFNQRYYYRMIGIETMEHWQNNLQEKFDAMAPRYELAYTLFDEHGSKLVDDVIDGETETIEETNQASGTDSTEYKGSEALATTGTDSSTHSEWDTPDSAINVNASYADRRATDGITHGKTDTRTFTERADDTTYGRLDTHDVTRTKLITGEGILSNINATVRNYTDVDTQFINEFDDLFLSVYWY